MGKLRDVCRRVSEHARGPVGVIGMCLTGAFPLALLGEGVQAAVLCQPTLPFNALFMRPIGAQRRVLGLASPQPRSRRQTPDRRPGDALPE